ncbi:uncharacterized protein LOC107174936 [Citrus sinensis]|uniref:uncharacterized protein LOC107174936 n=1 Tax=Citrus sinensis TaxID=2711 RepID=UPI000CECEAE9|nr:uncharacterized protein LOC107174936 [Citrus sinensis]XP_024042366.1 uncharacterized protein LOC112099288 [Citrus x clementina]
MAGAFLARGSYPRFSPDGLLQGGVEEEAGVVEPQELGAKVVCGDRTGVAARVEGFARDLSIKMLNEPQEEDDVVCDPTCVEELYKHAASKDKTLRIYPVTWHQLIGEPGQNVELVSGEVVEWLRERASRAAKGSDGSRPTAELDSGA